MTIPWLIGQLFEPVGQQAMPLVVMVAILLSIGVLLLLLAQARRMVTHGQGSEIIPAE